MRTIEWKKRNGTMEAHCIYTLEEANRLGVNYIDNWRDGDIGIWVKTDDGHVVQVLRINYDRAGRKLLGTATMTTNAGSKTCELNTVPRQSRYSINGKVRNHIPKHMTADLSQFCIFIIVGMDPAEAYLRAFYEKNTGKTVVNQYVKRKARELMSSEIVQTRLKEGLGNKMDDLGLTREWILRQFKYLILTGDNDSAKVTALNKLSAFQGMDGQAPVLPQLPPISQETLDKLAKRIPVQATVEDEPQVEPTILNGDIVEAELVKEEKEDEKTHTHVGPSGPFNPDSE